MPTYEFRCPSGHDFEKFYRTISGAESQAACPVCGKPAERIMSAAGFAFKGSGFYLTDYGKDAHRQKGADKPAASKDAASTPSGDAGSAKAESSSAPAADAAKPEKKAEPKAESKPAAPAKPSSGE